MDHNAIHCAQFVCEHDIKSKRKTEPILTSVTDLFVEDKQ